MLVTPKVPMITAQIEAVDASLEAVANVVTPVPFTECAQAWQQRERQWKSERTQVQTAADAEHKELAGQLAALAGEDPDAEIVATRDEQARRMTFVTEAALKTRRRVQADLQQALANLDRDLRAAQDGDHQVLPVVDVSSEITARRRTFTRRGAQLDAQLQELNQAVQACAQMGMFRLTASGTPSALNLMGDLDARMDLLGGHLTRAANTFADIRASRAHRFCRPLAVATTYTVGVLPALMGLALFWQGIATALFPMGMLIAVALLLGSVVFHLFWRWKLAKRVGALNQALEGFAVQMLTLRDETVHEQELQRMVLQRRMYALTLNHANRTKALKEENDFVLGALRRRELELRERVTAWAHHAGERNRQQAVRQRSERRAQLDAALSAQQQNLVQQLAACDQRWATDRTELETRWQTAIERLQNGADAMLALARTHHPAWSAASWTTWTNPSHYARDIALGFLRRPLVEILVTNGAKLPLPAADAVVELPVLLTFPAQANVLIRTQASGRTNALTLINGLLMRTLSSFPGGGVRLTLVDPVGLGNSFAGLLDLQDHDDALLGSAGVLVEPERIEQGLQDLCLHLETVIQKHLRGRYDSLNDYNRDAGELREAVRFLVIADFPTGFGERALERLDVIARSGARCGVHLVLLMDERKQLPPPLDLGWLRSHALLVRHRDGQLQIERDGLDGWSFIPEVGPPTALREQLIKTIGEEAHRSRRVTVNFANLVPADEAMWSLSSATHVRIPIGKRGAEGPQYFSLGQGTAQHALIGGRTGSGKSTLFHVLITSAALWYSPREVQFHLIDFKKGVEFKVYAANHLPHAQVIAIESDREFGLSVLRHLDHELARRGDAFRQVGAQDLAAHRASGGEHLPRILLLIDEFQEFFTEDDAIARDAALLLDRFVRQGRAFGLHVVLGSQTLGGAYSLAKSSIGQMGVRVALPCNEADAHLLLHEDNDAARLLSRPGDGIYNDRAGLVEGNSPFQVCWLPEDQETVHLQRIATRTQAEGSRAAKLPVVFEGNGPSRLEDVAEQIFARVPSESRLSACIGQSSSLKGPAEVMFPAAAGGNVLIIGQNRDSAVATCAAIAIGAAARRGSAVRLLALDGEEPEGPFATMHGQLAAVMPQTFVRHDARGLPALITELSDLLERRSSGAETDLTPVLLVVFSLQRLRQLRTDDDSSFGRDAGEPPAERFTKLLANGPEYGIHTVVWCDSLASVQRSLGRRAQRDFDARILFQMSATDSNELIDDDGASRLGLHTALLSVLAEGRRDKFRPFTAPTPEFLERVRSELPH